MYYVGADFGATDGCCGVTQLCNFCGIRDSEPGGWWASQHDFTAAGKTEAAAYNNLFAKVIKADPQDYDNHEDRGCDGGRVIQAWFYKPINWDDTYAPEYVAEPLRLLIAGIPGVIDLGEHINPNTSNKIQGYQWEYKPNE